MIRYALICEDDHRFEAWFSSSEDYDKQNARGLIECPHCGSIVIQKQIMAPAVRSSRKAQKTTSMMGGEGPSPGELEQVARKMRAHIRNNFDYVGTSFADEARAMHDGEKPERLIYGETTPQEREKLSEDGVPCAPLPDAFTPTPPKKAN